MKPARDNAAPDLITIHGAFMAEPSPDIAESFTHMVNGVIAGDRRALAKAITLVESARDDDRAEAEALLRALMPRAGNSLRIGLSGAPGAGKSTFIEAFGMQLIADGHQVAVLAVDPSSRRSGGSILGDKTRMEQLSRNPSAFIRPSPSGGELGGVARRTRETIALVEAAGFDRVLVETVGVGQSETAVADMTDLFVLLLAPAGGDELQGVKRGIMELADIILVTKADGDMRPAALRQAADVSAALMFMSPRIAGWRVPVIAISALEGTGLDQVKAAIADFAAHDAEGRAQRRKAQDAAWMWNEFKALMLARALSNPKVAALARLLEDQVMRGEISPVAAARALVEGVNSD